MKPANRIFIRAAVAHFGRQSDGFGGKAELARALGVSPQAVDRWAGPFLPPHHAATLLQRPHRCRHLIVKGKP